MLQTKEEVVQVVQMSFIACRVDDGFKLSKKKYPALAASLKKYQAYQQITDEELFKALKPSLQKFLCQTHAVLNEYPGDQIGEEGGRITFVNNWTVAQIEQVFSEFDPKAQQEYLLELRKLRKELKKDATKLLHK